MNIIPINWQSIHTIFLDLDGTLLDLHFDNYFWLEHMPVRYAEKYNISVFEAKSILMECSESTKGTLNWYCLEYWSDILDMDVEVLKHEVAEKIAIRENVIPFLLYVKSLNKRVVLLTNAHRKSLKVKFKYIDIESYFDEIITSHDIKFAKEEAGFWEALTNTESYDKNHSLFIDDNVQVLDNANKYGIKYLLTISHPDSNRPVEKPNHYVAIDNYQQLMNTE